MLSITSPCGIVFPYIEPARRYLEAPAGANISDYYVESMSQAAPITVQWLCDLDGVTAFGLEYTSYLDCAPRVLNLPPDSRSYELYNLYKGTEYRVRLLAIKDNDVIAECSAAFTTTDLGPRTMNVDGVYNVRDVGGYTAENGRRTRQGILYRGGSLTPADIFTPNITDKGKECMSREMGIKTEIDLRTPAETGISGSVSLIPGAELRYINVGSYADISTHKGFRDVFAALANDANYPIYYHCTGGADRTGTVTFLLNALLGVPEADLVRDYEFTSFSVYGERNSQYGVYSKMFKEFRAILDTYPGDRLSERVENYILSVGVTAKEIESIKKKMYEV